MASHGFSERRACRLIGANRSAWQYEPVRSDDGAARERLRAIANERRRFGYRRLALMLRREGKIMNLKKIYRLYREERLTVRKRGGRKRALGTRAPMTLPQRINQRWSLDFVSDALACGRRFRVLNVIDDWSRECLASVVDTSISGVNRRAKLTPYRRRTLTPIGWGSGLSRLSIGGTRGRHRARPRGLAVAAVGGACGPTGATCGGWSQAASRFLNRQLSLPVSTMSQ